MRTKEAVINVGSILNYLKSQMDDVDWGAFGRRFAELPKGVKGDAMRIWLEVRTNRARLEACSGPHEFVALAPPSGPRKYRCSACHGELWRDEWTWYQKGLIHGRKD